MDRVVGKGLELVELADGVSLEDLRACTGAAFEVRLSIHHFSLSVICGV